MKIYFHLNLEGFSNCYIVANPEKKEAVIIDPGKITNQIIHHIEDDKYTLCAVLVTHNHGSHTRGLSTLRKIYNPEVYAADYEAAGPDTNVLKGNGIIKAAGFTIGYMSVPGHSPDSMCYKIGKVIFTGDTISAGKIGDTNNTYARSTLISNVQTKILSQQEDITLMPGHGPPTSIAAEKQFNLDLGYPILRENIYKKLRFPPRVNSD
ncbi:MAG: MBL fold metallo-hydrolase [Treponemataceae bacterium]|nr:MBL fold metallo-hydrolase [Treponemataceae bacterium]